MTPPNVVVVLVPYAYTWVPSSPMYRCSWSGVPTPIVGSIEQYVEALALVIPIASMPTEMAKAARIFFMLPTLLNYEPADCMKI
jgi:hypothetical protein